MTPSYGYDVIRFIKSGAESQEFGGVLLTRREDEVYAVGLENCQSDYKDKRINLMARNYRAEPRWNDSPGWSDDWSKWLVWGDEKLDDIVFYVNSTARHTRETATLDMFE